MLCILPEDHHGVHVFQPVRVATVERFRKALERIARYGKGMPKEIATKALAEEDHGA